MERKRIVLIHIFIWIFAIAVNLPYSGLAGGMTPQHIVSNIIAFLYLMVVFYLFYCFITPGFLDKKRLSSFFAFSFLAVLILPFFGYSLLFMSRAYFDGTFRHFFRGYSLNMHLSGYYPVLTAAVFGSFFRIIISWFTTMSQKAETEKQKLAMELDLLKGNLNQHFLFNTLNNIDSLINTDPGAASEALIKLSGIMRYLTYETERETVELLKETEYIASLVDLYRIRIKSPDDIKLEINVSHNPHISPALFVVLIENAFKYASFSGPAPAIGISLKTVGNSVIFKIVNFYDSRTMQRNGTSGKGLDNLRKRLELLYPGKHALLVEDTGSQYIAILTLETDAVKLHSH